MVVEPDQERLKQLHGEDYSQQRLMAAMVGKAEATWNRNYLAMGTGHCKNDNFSDLLRNRHMSDAGGIRCLSTEEVGGNYRKGYVWEYCEDEGEEAWSLHA